MPSTFSPVLPPELWPLGQRDQAADSTPNDDSSLISLLKGLLLASSPAGVPAGVSLDPLGLMKEIPFGPIVLGATSYPVKSSVGGLIPIDVSAAVGRDMANAWIRETTIRFMLSGTTVTAAGSIVPVLFSGNPVASAITDAGVVTLDAADRAKVAYGTGIAAQGGVAMFETAAFYVGAVASYANGRVRCDATGKIYLSLQATGASTLTGTGGLVGAIILGYDPA